MKDIYTILENLRISYEKHEHPAVFTVKESKQYKIYIDFAASKNLFLRNKKGNAYYLVVMHAEKRLNLKDLEKTLNEKNLGFASPEKMAEYLGVTPGSVSPFGLINDRNNFITVIIDNDLMKSDKQGYHPNINTATLVIKTDDFKKFLEWTGNKTLYISI